MPFEGPIPREIACPVRTPEDLLREDFEAWLKTKDPNEFVAQKWSQVSCPIAKWLIDTGQSNHPFIGPHESVIDVDICNTASGNPEWMNAFVREVDLYNRVGPITASRCLEIVTGIR